MFEKILIKSIGIFILPIIIPKKIAFRYNLLGLGTVDNIFLLLSNLNIEDWYISTAPKNTIFQ